LPKAVFAKCAKDAFRALSQQEFKVIFLDHDLHWMHADNSIFKGTGKEVARFLAEKGFQGIVIIHSRHEDGAAAMKKYLSNARLAPFGSFDITSEIDL
jgi:DNA-binding LacI/PurR family transcriptional regulator